MSHPYRDQANSSRKSKAQSMGKINNLDIPTMRAVGENSSKKIATSSASMQHKDQSGAAGMKRGGHVGKPKHRSKPKTPMVVPEATAIPPSPDPSLAAAGAVSSPAPAPMPGQPPMKRGGAAYARGGRAYPEHGGAANGEGRLDLSAIQGRKKK